MTEKRSYKNKSKFQKESRFLSFLKDIKTGIVLTIIGISLTATNITISYLNRRDSNRERAQKQLDEYAKLKDIALQLSPISTEYFGINVGITQKIYPTHKKIFKIYESELNILNKLTNKSEVLLVDSINKFWTNHYDNVNFYVMNYKRYVEDPKNDWLTNQIDSSRWEDGLGKHYDDVNKLIKVLFGYSKDRIEELNREIGNSEED